MEYDPEQINLAIAQHFCGIIHGKLVGEVDRKVTGHIAYAAKLEAYRDDLIKNLSEFNKHLTPIVTRYNKSADTMLNKELFVDAFVENYTFAKVFKNLKPMEKLRIMQTIIVQAFSSYTKFIHKQDPKMFFKVELTDEQKTIFAERFALKLHHTGVIEKYRMYSKDSETVPKNLFLQLRKKYAELKRSIE